MARVASLKVTRALTLCRPGRAFTDTWNGDLVRLLMRLPSMLKTTRLIMRPRTLARNPAVQELRAEGGFRRRKVAVPLRVGLAGRLNGRRMPVAGAPPETGVPLTGVVVPGVGVVPGGEEVPAPHIEASRTLWIKVMSALERASRRPLTEAASPSVI